MNVLRRIWPGGRSALPLYFVHQLAYGFSLFLFLGIPLLFQGVPLREGQVAPRDIVAPKSVEIVDAVETEKRKQEILAAIPPVYRVDEVLVRRVKEDLEGFFAALEEVRKASLPPLPETVDALARKWGVTAKTILWLLEAPQDTYEAFRGFLYDLFTTHFFLQPVPREDAARVFLAMSAQIESSGFSEEAAWVAGILIARFFQPNAVVDEAKTQALQEEALASFEPVRRIIRRGETLVRQGEVVTKAQLEALEALGIPTRQESRFRLLVLSVLIVGVVILEYRYLARFASRFLEDQEHLLIRTLALDVVLALNILTTRISGIFFVAGALPLLLFSLFGREVAFGESLVLFPLLLWAWRVDPSGSILLFVHLVLPLFLGAPLMRRHLIRAGGILSLFGMVFGALAALSEGASNLQLLATLAYGGAGGVMASFVALGGLSLFEHLFPVTTDVRLLELLNPNHPLLKRLMFEAPGTYSHSLVVANLAEVAAEEIGANALLARVGAYYHDIGKLKRPQWFIENQLHPERNIHNRLSPYLSVLVIVNHVRDGLEIAREFHLPREVQRIIQSHHGRSVVRYFYEKALRSGETKVSRDVFRYPGPLPRTPEEAIVFLADSVEAAVRSMKDPTPRRVETTVRNIVRMYLEDGQLDESSLTLRDINRIAYRFVRFLNGMIHARIPYPELLKEGSYEKG